MLGLVGTFAVILGGDIDVKALWRVSGIRTAACELFYVAVPAVPHGQMKAYFPMSGEHTAAGYTTCRMIKN